MCYRLLTLISCLCLSCLLAACYPPQVQYPYTVEITQRRHTLKDNLIALLPAEQQKLPQAIEEASWLADTAYKAAAGISRVNDSHFPGWAGNALVNARLQDRGLCWHYQHDMYRELRRRPLKYFRIGCCVRDMGKASEHNCIYLSARNDEWPKGWVLDAWMWNGRLKVDDARLLDAERWHDLPTICQTQEAFYPEGHNWPIEHWSVLRAEDGDYQSYFLPETRRSAQYRRMYENIERGRKEHPGSLTNY